MPDVARRVLTRDEAVSFATALLNLQSRGKIPSEGITLQHQVLRTVRITNNTRVVSAESDRFHVTFDTAVGSNIRVEIDASIRDFAMLRTLIRQVEAHAAPPLRPEDIDEDPDDPWHVSEGPHMYLPVSLWHPATYDALVAPSQQVTATLVERMGRSGLTCAGTITLVARAELHFHPAGKLAWGEDTDSEVTVTGHTSDGKASGWSGQAARNWSLMHPEHIVDDAIDMARRNQNRVRVEPGRYTAILGPAAVGGLFGRAYSQIYYGSGPWSYHPARNGKYTKLGERVCDPRLTMWSDPTDPNYGDYPFFWGGVPSGKATWVDKGVLTALACDPGQAKDIGVTPIKTPRALRISGGDASITDMIANCERGIYVHRITGPQPVDWKSGMLLGHTRDGCFLVKNGKIVSPVINFRFCESPFLMITKVLALGVPERVAFGSAFQRLGNALLDRSEEMGPPPPMVVPPMMVQDFNFSALSDAV